MKVFFELRKDGRMLSAEDNSGSVQQQAVEEEPDPPAEPGPRPAMAIPLPEELMSSVLVFLRMKDMLEWRLVSGSTKSM